MSRSDADGEAISNPGDSIAKFSIRMVGRAYRSVNDRTALNPSLPENRLRTRVGTAGWSYSDWRGPVYPPRPGPRFDALAWIARFFDLVEVNVSFYRLPSPRTSEDWARRVESRPGFEFAVKLPQAFTHGDRRLEPSIRDRCADFLAPLVQSGRLGPLLAQFPWSFRPAPESVEHMRRLRDAFRDHAVVFELRHGDWEEGPWLEQLESYDLPIVSVDQPVVGRSLGLAARPGPVGYLRVHGRNTSQWFAADAGRDARYDYLYGENEIDEIASVARTLADQGPVYVVTNNHFRGQAVLNALEIREVLGQGAPEIPSGLWREFPHARERALTRGWTPDPIDPPDAKAGSSRQGDLFA